MRTILQLLQSKNTGIRQRRLRSVLAVHDDPGAVLWLGANLVQAGFQPLPAKSIRAAQQLLSDLQCRPDLVVINAHLRGSAAFVREITRVWGPRILVLTRGPIGADRFAIRDSHRIPDDLFDAVSLLRKINRILGSEP
jgi:response regulator RpfG family c-di-GMP phosphodiesterase